MTRGDVESLTQRIRNAAAREGIASSRMRNRIAFERVLARLAHGEGWVLKGGFSLEVRFGLNARATRDLDLLRRAPRSSSALDLQDALDEALDSDHDGDGFSFRVRLPKAVRVEDAEPSTWRTVVEARYGGAEYGLITVDIVTAPGQDADELEFLRIEPAVVGEPFDVPAIDLHRHAAEKYHAYSRIYARERPSSRVKDLVDLVLLDESGLLDDARLCAALSVVFAERSTPLPAVLPEAPNDWTEPFAALAVDTGCHVTSLDAAREVARARFERARAQEGSTA